MTTNLPNLPDFLHLSPNEDADYIDIEAEIEYREKLLEYIRTQSLPLLHATKVVVDEKVVRQLEVQYQCPVWIGKDGSLYPLAIMEEQHMKNVYNVLCRLLEKGPQLREEDDWESHQDGWFDHLPDLDYAFTDNELWGLVHAWISVVMEWYSFRFGKPKLIEVKGLSIPLFSKEE